MGKPIVFIESQPNAAPPAAANETTPNEHANLASFP